LSQGKIKDAVATFVLQKKKRLEKESSRKDIQEKYERQVMRNAPCQDDCSVYAPWDWSGVIEGM
jgi:hypothetical protein